MAKVKRIWRESQHPRDAKGRFSRRGGAAWVKRAASELMSEAGAATRAGGRPRISRNAKAGAVLQAHTDGGRPSVVRVPQATVTPTASPKNLADFNAKGLPVARKTAAPQPKNLDAFNAPDAPRRETPEERRARHDANLDRVARSSGGQHGRFKPRPAPGAAALIAARSEEQAPQLAAMRAARVTPEAAPVQGADAYAAMRRHTLLALAKDAGISIRGKSNTQIANELAAHDAKVKADRAAKLNPSGVGVDTPRVGSDNGGMTSTTSGPARPMEGWRRDPNVYDPQAQTRDVEVDGERYQVNNLGAGRPMTIRTAGRDGQHVGMADWENWDQVAAAVRRAKAKAAAERKAEKDSTEAEYRANEDAAAVAANTPEAEEPLNLRSMVRDQGLALPQDPAAVDVARAADRLARDGKLDAAEVELQTGARAATGADADALNAILKALKAVRAGRRDKSKAEPGADTEHLKRPKAKKGDLVVIEETSSSYIIGKGSEEETTVRVGIVTSTDRDGRVTSYSTNADGSYPQKVGNRQKTYKLEQERVDVQGAMAAAAANPWPHKPEAKGKPFASLAEARAAVAPHLGDQSAKVKADAAAKRAAASRRPASEAKVGEAAAAMRAKDYADALRLIDEGEAADPGYKDKNGKGWGDFRTFVTARRDQVAKQEAERKAEEAGPKESAADLAVGRELYQRFASSDRTPFDFGPSHAERDRAEQAARDEIASVLPSSAVIMDRTALANRLARAEGAVAAFTHQRDAKRAEIAKARELIAKIEDPEYRKFQEKEILRKLEFEEETLMSAIARQEADVARARADLDKVLGRGADREKLIARRRSDAEDRARVLANEGGRGHGDSGAGARIIARHGTRPSSADLKAMSQRDREHAQNELIMRGSHQDDLSKIVRSSLRNVDTNALTPEQRQAWIDASTEPNRALTHTLAARQRRDLALSRLAKLEAHQDRPSDAPELRSEIDKAIAQERANLDYAQGELATLEPEFQANLDRIQAAVNTVRVAAGLKPIKLNTKALGTAYTKRIESAGITPQLNPPAPEKPKTKLVLRTPTTNRKQIPRSTKEQLIAAKPAEKATPTRRLQTFSERMAGDMSDADRLAARLRNEEERQKLRERETERARQLAEERANDTRPEREKLAEQLQQDRDADHNDRRGGRTNPQRLARIKKLEARIEELDTEDRKAKIKSIRKGDKVTTTYKGETIEVEVVGKTSDGYLRVLMPDGRRGSLHPKFIEGVTPAPKADAASVAVPGSEPKPKLPPIERIPKRDLQPVEASTLNVGDTFVRLASMRDYRSPLEDTVEGRRLTVVSREGDMVTARTSDGREISQQIPPGARVLREARAVTPTTTPAPTRRGIAPDAKRGALATLTPPVTERATPGKPKKRLHPLEMTDGELRAEFADPDITPARRAAIDEQMQARGLSEGRADVSRLLLPGQKRLSVSQWATGVIASPEFQGSKAQRSMQADQAKIDKANARISAQFLDVYEAERGKRPFSDLTEKQQANVRLALDIIRSQNGPDSLLSRRADAIESDWVNPVVVPARARISPDAKRGALAASNSRVDTSRDNSQNGGMTNAANTPAKPKSKLAHTQDSFLRAIIAVHDEIGAAPEPPFRFPNRPLTSDEIEALAPYRAAYMAWERRASQIAREHGSPYGYSGGGDAAVRLEEKGLIEPRNPDGRGGLRTPTAEARRIIASTSPTPKPVKKAPATGNVAPVGDRPRTGTYTGDIQADRTERHNNKALTDHVRSLVLTVPGDQAESIGYGNSNEPVQVGDEVFVFTFNKWRRGIVTGTTRGGANGGTTRVMYSTPTGDNTVMETTNRTEGILRLVDPSRRPGANRAALLPKIAPEVRARPTEADKAAAKEARKEAEKAAAAKRRQQFFDDKIKAVTEALGRPGTDGPDDPEWHLRMTTEEGLISLAKHLKVKVPNREQGPYGPKSRTREQVDAIRRSIVDAVRARRDAEGKA